MENLTLRRFFRVLLTLFLSTGSPLWAEKITLRLGHVQSSGEPIHQSFLRFANRVEEKSQGRVVIHVYEASALGTNKEVYELARLGASVIANVDSGYLSDYVPDIGILTGPYLLAPAGNSTRSWLVSIATSVWTCTIHQ